MAFVDPPTKLRETELDAAKGAACRRMVAARDTFIWAADMAGSTAYNKAHAGVLACRTEVEVMRIEEAFVAAMTAFRNVIVEAKGKLNGNA